MHRFALTLIYLIFFLSGAAALVYQVVWTRMLGLVFGASHLAVTTVLAVFMGGLALGSFLIGRRLDRTTRLLRLYGFLELGIGAGALLFLALLHVYPAVYVPLARLAPHSQLYLSTMRVLLASLVLIVPTTLMGGTLPVVASFLATSLAEVRRQLSFLYAVNTFGAVTGAAVAGFILLRHLSAESSIATAVVVNLIVGAVAMVLDGPARSALASSDQDSTRPGTGPHRPADQPALPTSGEVRLVLWAIAVSGFCALGYEILWTRVLSVVIGASVYGFTIMLMAFLTGIATGSSAYGLLPRRLVGGRATDPTGGMTASLAAFGLVEVAIGVTALTVTILIRDLPTTAHLLQSRLLGGPGSFLARQSVDFVLAFSYMFVPAFFMGLAFPLAGTLHAAHRRLIGRAVGETLAYNTIGAILGSAVSGFVLVHAFGIERSLQLLAVVNLGLGTVVIASAARRRSLIWTVAGVTVSMLVMLAASPGLWRVWDAKFFAVYQTNRPDKFSSEAKVRDVLRATEVLYFAEGTHAAVSSIKVRGGTQSFLTNGRIEATDSAADLACQYALGHLPMLLHPAPRDIFVLGAGSGMTLGATSAHPGVTSITLAEIEPRVLGVARTFAHLNHDVLNDPRLKVVINDGRNFLLTTEDRFDVITADPIHPWFSGAGYLYSKEYFDLAASRLRPGGVACQWLPIYELSEADLKSVVATFRASFAYVLIWVTYHDAELVGSNAPFQIDVTELERRIVEPAVRADLDRVDMASAEDFLSFFVMGTAGADRYCAGGVVNTDDNLFLEFSAPLSMENSAVLSANCARLVAHRDSVLAHLVLPDDVAARARWEAWAAASLRAATTIDDIHVQDLARRFRSDAAAQLVAELDPDYSWYSPWRFLREELGRRAAQDPRIVREITLPLVDATGSRLDVRVGAVCRRLTGEVTVVDVVAGHDGTVLGHIQLVGSEHEATVAAVVEAALAEVEREYAAARQEAAAHGGLPLAAPFLARLADALTAYLDRLGS